MKIINFGSLNIDHVYTVDHFVRPGETLASSNYQQFCGGKGLNQSIALAHAGATVMHAGKIGADGIKLKERLEQSGVDTSPVKVDDGPTGHAIIQVNGDGENAIFLYGGANQSIMPEDINEALAKSQPGEYLLLQNEISAIPQIMEQAARRDLNIIFNPAPANKAVQDYPLELVRQFIVNEVEAAELSGENDPERMLSQLRIRFPDASIVLTLGSNGVMYADESQKLFTPAQKTSAVDTTAAGDTFIGYFLAERIRGTGINQSLEIACKAAAICVSRPGAADSIPQKHEVE